MLIQWMRACINFGSVYMIQSSRDISASRNVPPRQNVFLLAFTWEAVVGRYRAIHGYKVSSFTIARDYAHSPQFHPGKAGYPLFSFIVRKTAR